MQFDGFFLGTTVRFPSDLKDGDKILIRAGLEYPIIQCEKNEKDPTKIWLIVGTDEVGRDLMIEDDLPEDVVFSKCVICGLEFLDENEGQLHVCNLCTMRKSEEVKKQHAGHEAKN